MDFKSIMEAMEKLNGKNILVTGGNGFIGSHLVEMLLKKGSRVVIPYRSIDPYSYFSSKKMSSFVTLAQCDLKDFERVFDIVTKYEIDYIFHLGAQAIVTAAYHNPKETIVTNVLGTVNLLEAVRLYGKVKGIIIASSDKAYGKSSTMYVETDALRGDHPYEVSKSAEDLIAYSYFKTYGLPVVIARFGNVYGEGDMNFTRIVPGIIKSVITKDLLHLRSDGSYIRDYIYVKDVAQGYILLAEHVAAVKGEAFNFGSDDSLSVMDVIKLAEKSLRVIIPYTIDNTAINEIPRQQLDFTKIRNSIGWKPKFKMKKVLPLIKRWYKNYL